MKCLGCYAFISVSEYDKRDGVCKRCEDKLERGEKVKNSGGDPYAGRGLQNDPFVY